MQSSLLIFPISTLVVIQYAFGENNFPSGQHVPSVDNSTFTTINTKPLGNSDGLKNSSGAVEPAIPSNAQISVQATGNQSAFGSALVIDIPGQGENATIVLDAAHMNWSFVSATLQKDLGGVRENPAPKQPFNRAVGVLERIRDLLRQESGERAVELQPLQKGADQSNEGDECRVPATKSVTQTSSSTPPWSSATDKKAPLLRRQDEDSMAASSEASPLQDGGTMMDGEKTENNGTCVVTHGKKRNGDFTQWMLDLNDSNAELFNSLRQTLLETKEILQSHKSLMENLSSMPSSTATPPQSSFLTDTSPLQRRENGLLPNRAVTRQRNEELIRRRKLVVRVMHFAGNLLITASPGIGMLLSWPGEVLMLIMILDMLLAIFQVVNMRWTMRFLDESVTRGASPVAAFEALGVEMLAVVTRRFVYGVRELIRGPPRTIHVNEISLATVEQANGAFQSPPESSDGMPDTPEEDTILAAWERVEHDS